MFEQRSLSIEATSSEKKRKTRGPMFCVLVCLLALLFCLGACESEDSSPQKAKAGQASDVKTEWTVMVYMCADNNLEYPAMLDLFEMEQALPEGTEVIVLVDRHAGYTNILGDWKNARLYRVRKAPPVDLLRANIGYPDAQLPAQLSSELLEEWGEVDMSDPAVLTRFIETAAKRFPAKRYALIPWNHGGGWTGLLQDEDGGNGAPGKGLMSVEQFAEAARRGAKALPRGRFDLLKYELCLMAQLDVLSNSAGLADYVVACAPVEPGQGSDYLTVLPEFRAGVSTRDLVMHTVKYNTDYYTKLGIAASFSGFDMAKLEPVLEAHQKLMQKLTTLAPTRFRELTRATRYTVRHEGTEDLKRGRGSFSSLELYDWLARLEAEIPDGPVGEIKALRDALKPFLIATANTPNIPKCGGITTYLPLRREDTHPMFADSPVATTSGKLAYLKELFKAQETLGSSKPAVRNIVMGRPEVREGRDGTMPEDFNIVPLTSIRPFAHSVVRFEVVGSDILWTTMTQYQRRGNEAVLHFTDLVVDQNAVKKRREKAGSLLEALSPVYNDGTTMLMREITGQRFKVTNGSELADITVDNTDISSTMNKATATGLYTDPTLGGRELFVQLVFNTEFRMVQSVTAIERDAQGRVSARAIQPRKDGFFRPGQTIMNRQGIRTEFGQPMAWNQGLLLTLGLVEEGTEIGNLIEVETVGGQKASAWSDILPVYHDPAQKALLNNTRTWGMQGLDGRYAMLQYATTRDGVEILPTFHTLRLSTQGPEWELEGKGTGPFTWTSFATPMLTLYEAAPQEWLPAKVIASWYTFLDGTGPTRSWYFISIGDGTRWALYPMEYYQNGLEGTWVSKTERWVFKGNTVTLTRDGQTGSGTIKVDGNRFSATGMPFKDYAFHVDRARGKLVLMSREGVASMLTREGAPVSAQPAAAPASPVGEWRAAAGADHSGVTIQEVSGTPWFNMRLVGRDGRVTVGTFAVRNDRFLVTLRDGSHQQIYFSLTATTLTLKFPDGRSTVFSRVR